MFLPFADTIYSTALHSVAKGCTDKIDLYRKLLSLNDDEMLAIILNRPSLVELYTVARRVIPGYAKSLSSGERFNRLLADTREAIGEELNNVSCKLLTVEHCGAFLAKLDHEIAGNISLASTHIEAKNFDKAVIGYYRAIQICVSGAISIFNPDSYITDFTASSLFRYLCLSYFNGPDPTTEAAIDSLEKIANKVLFGEIVTENDLSVIQGNSYPMLEYINQRYILPFLYKDSTV